MADREFHNNHFFLQEHLVRGPLFHGGVGNKDAETVLLQAGYVGLRLGDEYAFGPAAKVRRLRAAWRLQRDLPQGATILFQWPLYASLHRRLLAHLARHRRDLRLLCFLTDINGIKDGDQRLLEQELKYLRRFSEFIVHNEAMRGWLEQKIPAARCSDIGFFDFLAQPAPGERRCGPELCFAGALDKSPFLARLAAYPELHFHLYGPGGDALAGMPNARYYGVFPAPELPGRIEGSFGLLWDGSDDRGLGGPLGDYARYISPHKLSLYLLSGLPVICHRDSAAAALVQRFRIGIAVSSIGEIGAAIQNLDAGDYEAMRRNMVPLAVRISTGRCLLHAIEALG
ncbi:hypothetical protein [Flaviaesturariibacter aridisoli]|uniref:Beta-1,6-galactofuranosyltransferase n=1 Tax=Flaviaesturariibacter aridisoli TaxID=2545761 RepID=A0A4R4DYG9_9BACT|nr:hypothetical protein [Flaviaesturariibacter aridisoli]TCZ69036.1 hypothetical protein E0486_12700 [Flaviaesturariibacter aridisoli]